jgi:uncharacterized cupin superfamily protein
MFEPVDEAPLERTEAGVGPTAEGWFIVNVADAIARGREGLGQAAFFSGARDLPRPFGINVHVLQPGEPSCMYHRDNCDEMFLVLSGECVAVVEEQERRMTRGDFLKTPRGCAHVLIGAGDGPCAILMAGPNIEPDELLYPESEVAARYGAAVETATEKVSEAYVHHPRTVPGPLGNVPW